MPKITVERSIRAPVAVIFDAVTNIEKLPETSQDVVAIEFLTEQKSGVGTRFVETRTHNGKPMLTELEVTEFEQDRRARMVTDSHGTVWDTVFTVVPVDGGGKLTIAMDARGNHVFAKVMNVLMQSFFRKGIDKHIEAVKTHCEAISQRT